MSLKITSTSKLKVVYSTDKRLDVKYFIINAIFDKLEKHTSCKVKTMDELNTRISSGSYHPKYVSKDKGIPYVRVGNIKPFSIDEQDRSLVFIPKDMLNTMKVKKNDIIMGRTQAVTEKLGVASIIDENNEGLAISQHISKVTINNNEINPYYLVAYLNSKFYKAQTALATHGDTRVEMTHSQLKNVRIFIPKKDILQLITDKVKKIISYNRFSIKNIKSAQEILRRKINIHSKNSKQFFSVKLSDLKEIDIWSGKAHLPKYTRTEKYIQSKFKTIKLKDITESILKGVEVGSSNYKTELHKKDSDYSFIRTSDITNNEIDIFPDYFVSKELVQYLDNTINFGDILFSKDGVIGETAIVSKHDKVVVAEGFAKIKLNHKALVNNISSEYLFTVLSLNEIGFYSAIRRTVIASTIPHLRIDRLKGINIPIIDKNSIKQINKLVKEAFELRDKKKELIKDVRNTIDGFFNQRLTSF